MNCPNCNHPIESHEMSGCCHPLDSGPFGTCVCRVSQSAIAIAALTAQNKELLAGLENLVLMFSGAPETHDELKAMLTARALLAKYGGNNA